ncbi:hypothetical protein RhiJN_16366 [Ceratobasidium sp. AG-Ba]|nr:hypothetical protein RhiJN_16365 [Ceratobasidium sp. AG-Ba]QRV88348.1 hypothetical protein RhiJN_16366 [Ceratobasidium sp. AG-Ba]
MFFSTRFVLTAALVAFSAVTSVSGTPIPGPGGPAGLEARICRGSCRKAGDNALVPVPTPVEKRICRGSCRKAGGDASAPVPAPVEPANVEKRICRGSCRKAGGDAAAPAPRPDGRGAPDW